MGTQEKPETHVRPTIGASRTQKTRVEIAGIEAAARIGMAMASQRACRIPAVWRKSRNCLDAPGLGLTPECGHVDNYEGMGKRESNPDTSRQRVR